MRARLDLTGCIFGSLTAIRPADNIKGRTAWICRCECGNECTIRTIDLRSGKRTTCGCRSCGLESLHFVDGTCIEMIQSKTVRSNNKSGVTGVFFENKSKKWRAEIMLQGKRKCLGRFSNLSEAIEARLTAEEKLHDAYISAYWKDNSDNKSEAMRDEITDNLEKLFDGRNAEFEEHMLRVKRITRLLAEMVQKHCPQYGLTDEDIKRITLASAVHDIGKIKIRDSILYKPGKLTAEEFEEMKTHTELGNSMLDSFSGISDEKLETACHNICKYHHERWDGKGYPYGLKGDDIPIDAQIVAVADVYDALTSERVYKPAFTHEESCRMILAGECGAFSGDMMECFKKCMGDLRVPHLIAALEPINEEDLLQVPGGMNASFENEENENNGRTD